MPSLIQLGLCPPANPTVDSNMSTRWGTGALKRDCVCTQTILNDVPASPQGSKRRKLENNDPVAESSDKKRSEEEEEEVRESTASNPLDASSDSMPSSPKRFFTNDGENELLAVALHLSRREEKLDQWRRLIVNGKVTAPPPEAQDQSPSSLVCSLPGKSCSHSPPHEEPASPGASEESFGGDWVDDVADKLLGGGSSTVMTPPQNTTAADHANSSNGDPAMTKHQW